jgi:exonuclease III
LSWNISSGGGNRGDAIVAAIQQENPDVAILSEYYNGSESSIGDRLSDQGLTRAGASTLNSGSTGLAVFSRVPISVTPHVDVALRSRWLNIRASKGDLLIAAVHVPGSGDTHAGISKLAFWGALLDFDV